VQGAADGSLAHLRRRVEGGALVQAHCDVRAEVLLDAHGAFGAQFQQAAVDVRTEDGGAVVDLEVGGEAEDLVTAAVGEDGPVPAHEAVQAAQLGDQLVARAQGEVVGVAEDDLHAGFFELLRGEALDGRLGADRHEHGRLDGAVRGVHAAPAGAAVGLEQLEAEGHWWIGATAGKWEL
jgi:hypothetical protein